MPTHDEVDFLDSLAVPDPHWGGMGAVRHVPSIKDYSTLSLPGVAELVAAGDPQPVDWSHEILQIENQGSVEGSCVGFSTALDTSWLNYRRDRGWDRGDGRKLWQEMGGVGSNGVDSRATLERVRTEGCPMLAGGRYKEVSLYTFVPRVPVVWRQTIAAAMTLGKGVVVALLLPPDLGWNSGLGISQGYHQMKGCGFTGLGDHDYCIFANSWGVNSGNRGFCRVPWQQMEQQGFQNNYAYCYVIDPMGVTPPPPPPPPTDVRREVIRLTNAHRQAKGLAPLVELPALMTSAQGKSQDMATKQYFDHTGPDGKGPLEWIKGAGVSNPSHWGENIAAGQTDPSAPGSLLAQFELSAMRDGQLLGQSGRSWPIPDANPGGAFTAWINSPGHRANIEFPAFTHIGVGHVNQPGTPYGQYWTQHFVRNEGDTPPPDLVEVESVTLTPTSVLAGERATLTVRLKQASPRGEVFFLTSDASKLVHPGTLLVGSLQHEGSVSVAAALGVSGSVPITITRGGYSHTAHLFIRTSPPPPEKLTGRLKARLEGGSAKTVMAGQIVPVAGWQMIVEEVAWEGSDGDGDGNGNGDDGGPPPPGDLLVAVNLKRYSSSVMIIAAVRDPATQAFVPAICQGRAGTQTLPPLPTNIHGYCTWYPVRRETGAVVEVSATAGTRKGVGRLIMPASLNQIPTLTPGEPLGYEELAWLNNPDSIVNEENN